MNNTKKIKNIMITGANGFIGSHLMKMFSEMDGYSVTGLVRKSSNLFRLEGRDYKLKYSSLESISGDTLRGIDVVIHTAGKASDWGKYSEFYKTNYEGTINLVKRSIEAGVKRFIHFSSTVVYGFNGNVNTKEDKPFAPFNNNYCITKALAEKELWKLKDKIEIIVIRPSNVFGPGDYSFTYPLIQTLEKGLIGFVNGGRPLTSPCYVKNLCRATELAVKTEKGVGEAFNISDSNDIPWIEFLKLFSSELKAKPPRLYIPASPLMAVAKIMEFIYRAVGSRKPPFLTPYRIAISSRDYSFSTEKAKRLLNYVPTHTTEDGVKESVEWYRAVKNHPEYK